MPLCEFGERQFELAANLELLGGGSDFFAPPPPLAAHLGIDVALSPGSARIWRLLGVQAPAGVTAGTGAFRAWNDPPPSAVPPFLVSLFLQYKRSSYLTMASAKEWSKHQQPYWRMDLSPHQQGLLIDLERAVGGAAVVRYAAPRFWTHAEMWQRQAAGAVLDHSLFVAPSKVGARHRRITWSPVTGALGHSEPETLELDSSKDVARSVRGLAEARSRGATTTAREIRAHLADLATAVEGMRPSPKSRVEWREELVADPEIRARLVTEEAFEPAADMAAIADAAASVRASWVVMEISPR